MRPNDEKKIELISGIDDKHLEKATATRLLLFNMLKKRRKKALISFTSLAASFVFIVSIALIIVTKLGFPMFGGGTVTSDFGDGPHTPEKQIPIYQGMTVSSTNPLAESEALNANAALPSIAYLSECSSARVVMLSDTKPAPPQPPHRPHDTEAVTGSPETDEPETQAPTTDIEAWGGIYYAKANEDFYITVHISNPDNFEILSFTLNGKKYSSYMFEQGSDMENLILKCNIGDVEGIVDYTIDAIKYVDGEELKDVRMDGDRTIKIHVYPENQPTVSIQDETSDAVSVTFTPTLTDALNLIGESDGEIYVKLYNGDTLVEQKALISGEAITFTGLSPETTYRCVCEAIYDAIDGQGKVAHILREGTATTATVINIESIQINGLTLTFDITSGTDALTALALYEGDTLYRELTVDTRSTDYMPFDKELSLVAAYNAGNTSFTKSYALPVIKESQGLSILNGTIVGIGSCTDPVLYLNHPIADSALSSTACQEIYCGEGVTSLGYSAFSECIYMTSAVLPKNLSAIEGRAFFCCVALTSINIPDSVAQIRGQAFSGCSALTSIDIPDSVTKIEGGAFANTAITDIIIPTSLTSIGGDAFGGSNLETATFADGTKIIQGLSSCYKLKTVIIPDSVTEIGESAFLECTSLTSIDIPDSVTEIGGRAFSGCSALTSIDIPDSVTEIREYTFAGCTVLKSIDIPDSVTQIGDGAFYYCSALTSIDIPNSVTKIGDQAFYKCSALTSIDIPDSVTEIREYTFAGCAVLKSIDIPDSVTEIGMGAFESCTALTSIDIPDSVTEIGDEAFYKCSALTSIDIPNSVTAIGDHAFYNCSALTSIDIPNSVTKIGDSAFTWVHLTSITIPQSLIAKMGRITSLKTVSFAEGTTTISGRLEDFAPNVTSVNIPDSVTTIGGETFWYCTALKSITIYANNLNLKNALLSLSGPIDIYIKQGNTVYLPDSGNFTIHYF